MHSAVRYTGWRVTEPKKQDGTMELNIDQIDLLDLPLPPRSKPELESEPHASKGPPPLPPSLPPMDAAAEEPPVPSLVLPEPSAGRATPSPPISARKLVGGPPEEQKSPIGRFLLGMGGATLLCVLVVVGYRMTHKTATPPAATSAAPAPTHAFTMAPIEFTAGPASSQDEAPPAPSAHASAATSASAAAPSSTSAHAGATAHPSATTTHGSTPATTTTAKPPRTDELIKVEN
jgi:hypothetical protein